MDARKDIGQRIARARRRRGLSQAVLAGLIGRSESWLSQVERGRRSLDSHTIINALAEILGLPVDDLTATKADTMTHYQAAVGIRQAMAGRSSITRATGTGIGITLTLPAWKVSNNLAI